jgi:hypothetical protein
MNGWSGRASWHGKGCYTRDLMAWPCYGDSRRVLQIITWGPAGDHTSYTSSELTHVLLLMNDLRERLSCKDAYLTVLGVKGAG